ncbi:serine/threonine-protein kinase [Actinoplanes regularis]|uniref:serine/threonine-protein kinase n=1 Tax=Actinoplanes regularis TaxID=52697 RepID=UPI002552FE8D|nr:serine/threonine-protein kinase [Actinoplanes regularis]GLW34840.1 hypothetical protein Areg01_77760 [Actinoplanes regularis]
MPRPGELLGGRYRLDDRIAAGGMGQVWAAIDTVLDRPVAVKTLLGGRDSDPGFLNRFRHEAQTMAALRHPGVVAVYDFGDTEDGAYLVMARVGGQPLNRILADRGRLPAAETMSIVAQAGWALQAAHEAGIVHRDVKPGNLIIEPDGTVVLVDFGVARSANSVTLTGAREVVGTALYIAPEQVSKRATGPAADIYALGALAYHCITGRPPFVGDNPLAVALQHITDEPSPLSGDVPQPIRDLIGTALAKQPDERFPSAAAMATAAEAAAAESVALTGGTAAGTEPESEDRDAVSRAMPAGAVAGFAGRAMVGRPRFGAPLPAGPARDGNTNADGSLAALNATGDNAAVASAATAGAWPEAATATEAARPEAATATEAARPEAATATGATGPEAATATRATGPAAATGAGGTGPAAAATRTAGPGAGAAPGQASVNGTASEVASGVNVAPRRRALVAVAAAVLVLLGLGATIALADPFGLFGDKPAGSNPAGTGKPSASVSARPTPKGTNRGDNTGGPRRSRPTSAPTDDKTKTTGPAQPTGAETTSTETTTPTREPTTAAPTQTSSDDENGGDDDNGGETDNSGSGNGNNGSGKYEG